MIARALILVILVSALVFGQVTANSVTVSVSRSQNLPPDEEIFAVIVTSGLDVGRDQVLAALQGSGITLANFQSVSTSYIQTKGSLQTVLAWYFSLPIAMSNLKTAVAQLSTVQANLAQSNPALTMMFQVTGTQVSQPQSCAAADLVSDARAKAQKMAAAAGQPLGAVIAMSSASIATDPVTGVFGTPTYQPVCSLTAKFALGSSAPLPTDTLRIAASRKFSIQPDQVSVSITLSADISTSLTDVLAKLQSTGVTAANLVQTYSQQPLSIQWTFDLPVPFAQLAATLASLGQLQQTIGPGDQPALSYSVSGPQISPDLQAAQTCSFPALVGDAQSQAQKLAAAAGVTLGPVAAVSDGGAAAVYGSVRSGDFSVLYDPITGPPPVGIVSAFYPPPPPPCALNVQFQLTH